jgi:hypothetical protein
LPVPVDRKRFLVPEWVFIFGMVGRLVNQTAPSIPVDCVLSGRGPVGLFAIQGRPPGFLITNLRRFT